MYVDTVVLIYSVPGYICLWVCPTISPFFLPLCVSLWPATSHCFCCFLPLSVYVCVYVCLWWAGRKLAVKWGDSSNVGQDWDQRDWETDPSALCKSSPQKQLALSLSLHSPPAEQRAHAHAHRHTHAQFYSRVSLSTCHFLETFHVKICNTTKLKIFSKFLGSDTDQQSRATLFCGDFFGGHFYLPWRHSTLLINCGFWTIFPRAELGFIVFVTIWQLPRNFGFLVSS